jgi:hypothetical protein
MTDSEVEGACYNYREPEETTRYNTEQILVDALSNGR